MELRNSSRDSSWETIFGVECNFIASDIKRRPAPELFFKGAYIRNYTVVLDRRSRVKRQTASDEYDVTRSHVHQLHKIQFS